MNDFFGQLLEIAGAQAAQLYFLTLLRVMPMVAVTPLFGGNLIPLQIRFAIGALLAFVLQGSILDPTGAEIESSLFVHAAREIAIGSVLAISVRIVFDLVTSTGALIDVARGASIASVLDPTSKQQNSILAVFLLQLLVVLFFLVGGHVQLIEGLRRSFEVAPIQTLSLGPYLQSGGVKDLMGLVADLFAVAIRLASPVIVLIFLLDLVLAQMSRSAQQIQPYFMGLVVKGVLGLAALSVILDQIAPVMLRETLSALQRIFGG